MNPPRFMLLALCALANLLPMVRAENIAAAPQNNLPASEPTEYYSRRIREKKVSLPEILARLKANGLTDHQTTVDGMIFDGTDVFTEACLLAQTEEDVHVLRDILSSSTLDRYSFTEPFKAFGRAYLRQKTAELKARHLKVALPEHPSMPHFETQLPKEIEETVRLSLAAQEPYTALTKPIPGGDVNSYAAIHEALHQVLARKPGQALQTLIEQSNLTTNAILTSGELSGDTSRSSVFYGIIVSLCDHEQYAEAIGAVLSLQLRNGIPNEGREFTDLVLEYLQACGVDWEPVCLGLLANVYASLRPEHRDAAYFVLSPMWSNLVLRGSERGIRGALTLIRSGIVSEIAAREFLIRAAGPYQDADDLSAPMPLVPDTDLSGSARRVQPFPAKIRQEVLATYATLLDSHRPPASVHAAILGLPTPMVAELAESLQLLLHHPSHPVAVAARDCLAEAGLASNETPITPAPPALHFLLDLPGEKDGLQLSTEIEDQTIIMEAEAGGRFALPMDGAYEPTKIKTVHLRTLLQPLNGDEVPSIPGLDLPAPKGKPSAKPKDGPGRWDGPWFEIDVAVENGDQQEHLIKPALSTLRLSLVPAKGLAADSEATVALSQARDPDQSAPSASLRIRANSTATFARLQPGTYRFSVTGPGFPRITQSIILKDSSVDCIVRLPMNHSIRGTAVLPDGQKVSVAEVGSVERRVESPSFPAEPALAGVDMWNLGPGKYRLLIGATTGETLLGPRRKGVPPNKRLPAHQGVIHEFEITEDSPLDINLGEFSLAPNAPEKGAK
jgi:hypothetical protein